MDHDTFMGHLAAEGERLVEAAVAADLTAAVPACPGWAVRDVLEHVAEVYEEKLRCVVDDAYPEPWPPAWPAERDPVAWVRDAHTRLYKALSERWPDQHAPTWYPPDQTVGFWGRRMAQETAVHRVDVESARRAPGPVDAELARDGVDEILAVMLAGDWSDDPEPPAGTVSVRVDCGDRFDVVIAPETVDVRRAGDAGEDAGTAPDATLAGEASDVLLWLWGRAGDDAVRSDGDPQALAQLRRRLALATQ